MADVLFVAITVAFFALAVLLVRGVDRIIGDDGGSTAVPAGPGAATATDDGAVDELVQS